MKTQILTFILLTVVITVSAQDTIVDKIGRKFPVYITNLTDEAVTFIAVDDSSQTKKTVLRKYLNKVIKNEAPVGSNVITCVCANEKGLPLLISFGKLLQKHGFSFDKVDKDFLIIETKMTKIKKSYNVMISISVDENKLVIRAYGVGDTKGLGLWGYGSINEREEYNLRGVKKKGYSSYASFAFDYAENLANEFRRENGCNIVYSKE